MNYHDQLTSLLNDECLMSLTVLLCVCVGGGGTEKHMIFLVTPYFVKSDSTIGDICVMFLKYIYILCPYHRVLYIRNVVIHYAEHCRH